MESNHTMSYDVDKSSDRMDDILNASDNDYCDKDSIPARSDLTFKNGYYVNVTAIFIDIVGSSDMTDEHKRPTLAKMYRAFLSECVAIEYSCVMGSFAIIRYYCYIPCTSTLLQATACYTFHTLYVLSFLICY